MAPAKLLVLVAHVGRAAKGLKPRRRMQNLHREFRRLLFIFIHYMYLYLICIHIYTYIYMCVICTNMCIYIYMLAPLLRGSKAVALRTPTASREKDRERERERRRELITRKKDRENKQIRTCVPVLLNGRMA